MEACVHPTLFALLFVISATAATSSASTSITSNIISTPAAQMMASAGASSARPTPAPRAGASSATTPAPPAGASSATTPASPAGASSATPTTAPLAGASSATTPAPPAGASSATTPAPPAGASSATPTTASPAGASSATTPAPPAGASSATPTTAPLAGASSATTPAPPAGASSATPTTASPAGASSATTPAPPAGASSATPTTASPAGASSATTPAPPAGASSAATTPAPPAGASSATTTAPPTAPAGTCQNDSCAGGSYCVNLNTTHFCQCIDGYYYNSSSCKKGKIFPGMIQVKTPGTSDLKNEKSINYQNLYMEVNKFFKDVFANFDYGQTVIQRVSVSAPARSQMRAGDNIVNVTVVNIFAEDTEVNEMTISNAIRNATSNGSSITNYISQDRCEFYGCVKESDCSNVFQCKCQAGYERPNPFIATCLPVSQKCPHACNSKSHTQCLVKEDGSLDCVCLAGYKKDDQEKCQACAFGYNGVNCEDNFQLILIILVPIAGVLILGMVIALVFVRSKKTKDTEEQNLIENDFQNLRLQQTTGFSSPAGGSIFPKITASFPRDGGMRNPYVNSGGIPRPDY
ncbi:mucin-13 isoform 2-T3 [Glossophaga mutica]